MRIKSNKVKAIMASYWRYTRQCPLVALEANCHLGSFSDGGQADILAVNKNGLLIETEVKLTIGDFRRDKKKRKHRRFRDNDGSYPVTYFYFGVPRDIANKVSFLCAELFPYAGVLGTAGQGEYDVSVYRKPKILSGKKLSFLQITRMAREQSATVCRLAKELAGLKEAE